MHPRSNRAPTTVASALCALLYATSATAQVGAEGAVSAQVASDAPTQTSGDAPTAPTEPTKDTWALEHRRYATRDGSSGGLYVADPGGGVPGAVRLQLFFDVRPSDDFLSPGLETSQNRQTLAVSWTALSALELYGSLYGQGTSIGGAAPSTVHVNGGQLGLKLFTTMKGPLQWGGGMRFVLIDGPGDDTPLFKASSLGLYGNGSLDLRRTNAGIPLLARLSAEYFFDNRGKIMEATESERYAALSDPLPMDSDDRHLLTRAERYALGVNRVDTLNVGVGVEVPLEVATNMFLHPLLEWRVGIPVNRQGYDCPTFTNRPDAGTPESDTDECLAIAGAQAWPMSLAIGLRVVPPVRGLSLAIALDLGLTGTSMFVHELAPTAPFSLGIALGYDYDARPAAPASAATAAAPAQDPAHAEGRVYGLVSDAATGAPLQGVVVRVVGSELGLLATDDKGAFTSYLLAPGPVTLELTRDGYDTQHCAATIAASGGDVRVACALTSTAVPDVEAPTTEAPAPTTATDTAAPEPAPAGPVPAAAAPTP